MKKTELTLFPGASLFVRALLYFNALFLKMTINRLFYVAYRLKSSKKKDFTESNSHYYGISLLWIPSRGLDGVR